MRLRGNTGVRVENLDPDICAHAVAALHSVNFFPTAIDSGFPVTFSCFSRIVLREGRMNFPEVYERYARDVHRFALYLCGNQALAEDLAAETFVHAFCGGGEIRVGTVKAYLFAIARNLYRDFLARERRLAPIADVPEAIDPAPGPDVAASERQTFLALLRAIQRLPEPQREALVLATDQDLNYEQIAAIVGCSVAAVKVRIHRARFKLKRELDAKEYTWKT
jgi:RNA polymerase sigma-70 factor (ECF subfamily)